MSSVSIPVKRLFLFLFFSALCRTTSPAAVRQVTLQWDPSSDSSVAGYKVYTKNAAGQYDLIKDAGTANSATVDGLTPGADAYFVVTAYLSSGLESLPSNEIQYSVPPLVRPSVAIQNPTNSLQVNGPVSLSVDATTTDPDSILSYVEFYQGSQKVSTATYSPFTAVLQNLQPGEYTLSAVAVDQEGVRIPSVPINVTVVQLAVASAQMQSNGIFSMTVNGAIGSTNRIWYSADLVNWQLLSTVSNSTGSITIEDPTAQTASKRFYKVTSP
jgi:hypothetical protein